MILRPLEPGDAGPLGDFFVECAADKDVRTFFSPHPLTHEYAQFLCDRVGLIHDRYFVAIEDDLVVGYMMLRGWDEGYDFPSFGACVRPGRRDRGLGHRLIELAISESRAVRASRIRLTVSPDNHRGLHLYRKFGFQIEPIDERRMVGFLELTYPPANSVAG